MLYNLFSNRGDWDDSLVGYVNTIETDDLERDLSRYLDEEMKTAPGEISRTMLDRFQTLVVVDDNELSLIFNAEIERCLWVERDSDYTDLVIIACPADTLRSDKVIINDELAMHDEVSIRAGGPMKLYNVFNNGKWDGEVRFTTNIETDDIMAALQGYVSTVQRARGSLWDKVSSVDVYEGGGNLSTFLNILDENNLIMDTDEQEPAAYAVLPSGDNRADVVIVAVLAKPITFTATEEE